MTIKNMIEELIELGYSQGSIADAVGTTQPTIHRALNGSDIRYTTGKAIESLYAKRVAEGAVVLIPAQERRDGDRRQAERREQERREQDRRGAEG
jgi:predicted transcriptional regulator